MRLRLQLVGFENGEPDRAGAGSLDGAHGEGRLTLAVVEVEVMCSGRGRDSFDGFDASVRHQKKDEA